MKQRSEFHALTLEEMEYEIKERKTLLSQLVGRLYTSILADEIFDLVDRVTTMRRIIEMSEENHGEKG
jgi:hypothetical protein